MTEKTTEWFLTQGALGVFCLLFLAGLIWQALRREQDRKDNDAARLKERQDCDAEKKAVNEAHKEELRANGRAYAELTKQTYGAIDQLHELAARLRP